MGLLSAFRLSRLTEGLARTRESIVGKLKRVLSDKRTIDEQVLEDLEEILLGADVGVATTSEILLRFRERVKERGYEGMEDLRALLREEIRKAFSNGSIDRKGLELSATPAPYVIMVVGVNGVGKTTTIGKLAHLHRAEGRKVLVAAADTFRAAANEQLGIWAERAGVEVVQSDSGDPAAVAFDALKAAIARGTDVMIVDTAGRLHTKSNLMEELKKIKRVLQKQMADAPHETLLVLDASIGQNAIQQAREFNNAVGITGLVVTKLDGTARGGVVLAIARELAIPVRYIGVGETIDDLQPFDGRAFVDALFGE